MAVVDLRHGDCRTVMAAMPAESVDAIVCDPPYHLTSIVKRFGKEGSAPAQYGTDGVYARSSKGFMGKQWDGGDIAFRTEVWEAALRVLKPGGHLLAFGGTRTFHRLACAIEDAGFEIRDTIMYIYGSGFPKSLDVSKAIDKAAGAVREVVGHSSTINQKASKSLKASKNHPEFGDRVPITAPAIDAARQWSGWGTALKPAFEPIVVARKPLIGTVAANVLAHGTGGLNVDGCRVGTEARPVMVRTETVVSATSMSGQSTGATSSGELTTLGRWPANLIHDGSEEVLAGFPQAKGQQGAVTGREPSATTTNAYGGGYSSRAAMQPHGDTGSAARFFYCAKASKRDRNEGLDGFEAKKQDESRKEGNPGGDNPRNRGVSERLNHHPTVKPTTLMQYLVRLVTPPGGIVLDPFMGSGSTGKAAVLEGFNFTGIELDVEYIEIARARIAHALQSDKQQTLAL